MMTRMEGAGGGGMTIKNVGSLRVGDRVKGTDGKPHTVTGIGNWTHGTKFLSVDGKPDGWMYCSDVVEVLDGKQAPQEAQ